MASDYNVEITVNGKPLDEARKTLQEIVDNCKYLEAAIQRSWLLRLIFYLSLKNVEAQE